MGQNWILPKPELLDWTFPRRPSRGQASTLMWSSQGHHDVAIDVCPLVLPPFFPRPMMRLATRGTGCTSSPSSSLAPFSCSTWCWVCFRGKDHGLGRALRILRSMGVQHPSFLHSGSCLELLPYTGTRKLRHKDGKEG